MVSRDFPSREYSREQTLHGVTKMHRVAISVYVNIGGNSGDTATLNFAFTGSSTIRQWEVKVTQIPCSSSYRSPPGCLQYYTGCEGTITSFNFINSGDTSAGLQLNNQCYNACIRQEEGRKKKNCSLTLRRYTCQMVLDPEPLRNVLENYYLQLHILTIVNGAEVCSKA